MEYAELNNGVKMPMLGYGVYQTPPEETERCVLEAVDVGYRSIDTAQAYGNEEGVGSALVRAGLALAQERGFSCVLVLGSEAYYSRFGFVPASRFGIATPGGLPEAHFMALRLKDAPLCGRVLFAEEFGIEG